MPEYPNAETKFIHEWYMDHLKFMVFTTQEELTTERCKMICCKALTKLPPGFQASFILGVYWDQITREANTALQ